MTIYQVAVRQSHSPDDYFNVFYYDITGDTPLDLQDFVDEFAGIWSTELASIVAPNVVFEDITLRLDVDGSIGQTITPTGGAIAGTAADNQFVGQLAVLVQKKTGGFVRPNLGRAFLPGISTEGTNGASEWTTTVITAAEAYMDSIIIVPFAGNGQAEMLLKASNPTAPNTNAYNSVTECVALRTPSALQSRKNGRGA